MIKGQIIRDHLQNFYSDVYTPEVLSALSSPAYFNKDIKELMTSRLKRGALRQQQKKRITFLDPESHIPRTNIKVQDARAGNFEGACCASRSPKAMDSGHRPCAKPQGSADGKNMTFQYARATDPAGVGYGILLYKFEE